VSEKKQSRVAQAIALIEEEGLSVAKAAERLQISPTSIYAGMKKLELARLRMQAAGFKPCPLCKGSGKVPDQD
jgi:transposase